MSETSSRQSGPEGRIDINLSWSDLDWNHQDGIEQDGAAATQPTPTVRIRSSRPTLASRMFENKSVDDTLALLPLLYSICARAQSVAAVRAVEAAMATPASAAVEAQRDALVTLETIREHLWRILIDWPGLMASTPQPAVLAPLNQALSALMDGLSPQHALTRAPGLQQPPTDSAGVLKSWQALRRSIEHSVFAAASGDWLQSSEHSAIAGLDLWGWLRSRAWLGLGDVALQALPAMPGENLRERFNRIGSESWSLKPEWHGKICETGPLARYAGHSRVAAARQRWGYGLGTRLLARLVALAEALAEVDGRLAGQATANSGANLSVTPGTAQTTPPLEPSWHGVAQVETSRGCLIHGVVLENGAIWRYRIVAPTEWNFHPAGIAARTLGTLDGQQDDAVIEQQARWLLQAIDPCVGYRLTLNRPLAESESSGARRA